MATKKVKPKLLDRKCSYGRSSLEYQALWQLGEHRLRVRRDRDAYAFQSSAIIERWNGEAWKQVESIPYEMMATSDDDSYVVKNAPRPLQAELADEAELLRLAGLILT